MCMMILCRKRQFYFDATGIQTCLVGIEGESSDHTIKCTLSTYVRCQSSKHSRQFSTIEVL